MRASASGIAMFWTIRSRLQVGHREAWVVEHLEPDRLEGGIRERDPLAHERVQRLIGVEVARVVEGRAQAEAADQRDDPADVEERQRVPEAVVGRRPEARPLHVEPVPDDRLVGQQAALRVRGGARRVHQEAHVPDPDAGLQRGHLLGAGPPRRPPRTSRPRGGPAAAPPSRGRRPAGGAARPRAPAPAGPGPTPRGRARRPSPGSRGCRAARRRRRASAGRRGRRRARARGT